MHSFKRLILSLLLVGILASPAWGAAAFVQSLGVNGSGGSTTIALTITAVGSGNLVFGCVGQSAFALTSVTDNQSNTYTIVDNDTTDDASAPMASFYLNNITNAPTIITAHFDGNATYRAIHVIEASGLDTTAPLDQHTIVFQTTPGTGANAVTTGAVATTADGEFVASCVRKGSTGGAGTYTVGTGYSNLYTTYGGGPWMASESLVQASAGSIAGTYTQSTNNNDMSAIMTFKVTGGGPPPPSSQGSCLLMGVC